MTADHDVPVACTLTGSSYRERLAWIARLTKDGLRQQSRHELRLDLHYAGAVTDRVREMVRNEERCCGFLTFTLRETANGVHLTVVAPERARAVADALFAQFTQATIDGASAVDVREP
jgi:hypothetical protein